MNYGETRNIFLQFNVQQKTYVELNNNTITKTTATEQQNERQKKLYNKLTGKFSEFVVAITTNLSERMHESNAHCILNDFLAAFPPNSRQLWTVVDIVRARLLPYTQLVSAPVFDILISAIRDRSHRL